MFLGEDMGGVGGDGILPATYRTNLACNPVSVPGLFPVLLLRDNLLGLQIIFHDKSFFCL